MLQHEKKLIHPIIIGTLGLVGIRALVNGLSRQNSKGQEPKSLPDFDVSKAQGKTTRNRNVSPKSMIEYKYKTVDGYEIYNYSTELSTDETTLIYCPELLRNNDLESLVFSRTAPYLGLASDLKMDPPTWAMAGTDTVAVTAAIRSKKQNKELIAKCLKRNQSNVAVLKESEKKLLTDLLNLVEKSLKLYETKCIFDSKGRKAIEKVSVLDTQRILAATLWTAVQGSTTKPYISFSEYVLEMITTLIENDQSLAGTQKNTDKYKSFVDCFEDGWFNCETPGASKLYVLSNPDLVLFRDMIPSKSVTVGGLPVAFPPTFEPIFISGAVFYASSF